MIVLLNGYPGVGKMTIGRYLAEIIDGKLLDIHSVYNVAFALTEFKSPQFKETVRKTEAIAHDLILNLPDEVPVVLTTVLTGESEWANEEWRRLEMLGNARPPFCVVHIQCDLDENIRRIQSESRDGMRKPRSTEMVKRNQLQAKLLAGSDAPCFLKLDSTNLTAEESAMEIKNWLRRSPVE
ncbi:MAG: AAA family ATPase [Roseibium sp.]